MCRVVISGFYGFDNAGDEAILQSMVSEFRKKIPDIHIVVLSANPSKTTHDHHVEAVDRSNLVDIYSAIKNCDVLISGGGSLLQDATSVLSMWYYSGIILLAFLFKKPVFAFAHGIGPIVNRFNIRLLKYIMNRVLGVSVRDKRSQSELKKLGVEREVSCTIDPAFLINAVAKEKSLELLKKENGNEELNRPKVGFSIRRWKGDVDISGIIAEVADKVYRELGADIVLFPLHYKKDISLAEEIASKMEENAIIVRGNYTSEELIGLYGQMKVNVCVRFHGLVFSIVNSVPVVAISYDPKIDSLMESLEMKAALRYEELSPLGIFNEIKNKWQNQKSISQQMNLKTEEFKQLAKEGMDEVMQWLEVVKK